LPNIITLTTDFGHKDPYVAIMKAVVLSIDPTLTMVDVSHEVAPQDVMDGAFVLQQSWHHFPKDTVHLVVVDPGVGTSRKAIAVRSRGHFFVGPDNGLIPLVVSQEAIEGVYELDNSAYWYLDTPSNTFHGRDIFAPVAAHLATGVSISRLGRPIQSLETLRWALPLSDDSGMQGWVVHVDHYGNCITNIPADRLARQLYQRTLKCYVGNTIIHGFSRIYADVNSGDPVLLASSSGYLEIAIRDGNAAVLLDIRRGSNVSLVYSEENVR
jgi:S-adenosylmethionine hydrolase